MQYMTFPNVLFVFSGNKIDFFCSIQATVRRTWTLIRSVHRRCGNRFQAKSSKPKRIIHSLLLFHVKHFCGIVADTGVAPMGWCRDTPRPTVAATIKLIYEYSGKGSAVEGSKKIK